MKKLIYVFATATFLFYSCNTASDNKDTNAEENNTNMNHDSTNHDMNHDGMNHDDANHGSMNHDGMNHNHDNGSMSHNDNMNHNGMHNTSMQHNEVAQNKTISTVLDTYLTLKNALVEDNDKKAAEAGISLTSALKGVDKSSLAASQTTKFDEIIESATEHAEHISENKGNLVHQREHLALLSKDVKDLVTLVGTDRTLYADFCPMYDNNKGAIWLSASKEIKNPYYGSKMLTCGKVQEEITVK
jgi:hypothetical protein